MKMLEAGGVPLVVDNLRQADIDNPNGYYELESVKALDKGDVGWLVDAQGSAVKVISALLVHHSNAVSFSNIREVAILVATDSQRNHITVF